MVVIRSVVGPGADISRSSRCNLEPAKMGALQEAQREGCDGGLGGEAQRARCAPVSMDTPSPLDDGVFLPVRHAT